MRLVYSQYFKLLAITFAKGFGAAPSASWDKLTVESWENAVYAAVPKEMISTTLMLSLSYVVFHGHCAPPGSHPLYFVASASTLRWRKARGGRRDHLVPASPPRSPPMGRGRAQAGGPLGCRTACALRRKRLETQTFFPSSSSLNLGTAPIDLRGIVPAVRRRSVSRDRDGIAPRASNRDQVRHNYLGMYAVLLEYVCVDRRVDRTRACTYLEYST
jgi:hypothetical protein